MNFSKIGAALVLCATCAFAQTGLQGGTDGLHQYNAITLGQWGVTAGIGGGVTIDSWAHARGGAYKVGNTTYGMPENSPSFDANLFAGVGLLTFLDVGFSLPYYYDHINQEAAGAADLWASGFGDLELWTKIRAPFINEENVFQFALQLTLYAPTGEEGYGARIRHPWYLNSYGYSQAFTANQWAGAAILIGTADLTKISIPLRFNAHVGYLGAFDYGANTLLWGAGINYLPFTWMDAFLEFHAETRIEKTNYPRMPYDLDPMVLTPGLRFHLPFNLDFALGLDIGLNNFHNPDYNVYDETKHAYGYTVKRKGEDNGIVSSYKIVNEPHYGVSAALTWRLGGKHADADEDKDGVTDENDKCPHTPTAAKVDEFGCALDSDKDSIPDYKDKCPNSKEGITVDSTGCPLDSDKDGVPDALDKCPNTKDSLKVDSTGCPLDSDKDGIPDAFDKCPNSKEGEIVDSTGCPADFDNDGVPDALDKCPNTEKGVSVNENGCPLDSDNDGVPDALDKCPKTPEGITVNENGCPLDGDKDGIPDALDKCPNSKEGEAVDSTGCPMDSDQDGVPDVLDKCPNTVKGDAVNENGCALDDDEDGVSNSRDKCPNSKKGEAVDSTGCPMDSDQDGVPDVLDKCPNTIKGQVIDKNGCPINKKQDLSKLRKGIAFKTGSSELTKNSYGTLDDIAALMHTFEHIGLEVQGHTDSTGSDEINKKLSASRAEAVVNYLKKKDVKEDRLRAIGYGSEKPVASNKTKAGRAKNRRVELVPFEK